VFGCLCLLFACLCVRVSVLVFDEWLFVWSGISLSVYRCVCVSVLLWDDVLKTQGLVIVADRFLFLHDRTSANKVV